MKYIALIFEATQQINAFALPVVTVVRNKSCMEDALKMPLT